MSFVFTETIGRHFEETVAFQRNGSGAVNSYSTRFCAGYGGRFGLIGYNYTTPGDYSDTTPSKWSPTLTSLPIYYFRMCDSDGARVILKPSTHPAHTSLNVSLVVTPNPWTLVGTWNPTSSRSISKYDGTNITTSATTENWDGQTSAGLDVFESWTSESVTNGGEGGDVVLSRLGTGTKDVYEDDVTGQIVWYPSNWYETVGDISGYTYIGEYEFSLELTVTFSSDYLHDTFLVDCQGLYDAVDLETSGFVFSSDVEYIWKADKSGVVDWNSVDGAAGKASFQNSNLPFKLASNWLPTSGGPPLTGGARSGYAGFCDDEIKSAGTEIDQAFSFVMDRFTYNGNFALYEMVFDHSSDPPTNKTGSVTSRTSLALAFGSYTILSGPNSGEVASAIAGDTYIATIASADAYDDVTPNFPAPT